MSYDNGFRANFGGYCKVCRRGYPAGTTIATIQAGEFTGLKGHVECQTGDPSNSPAAVPVPTNAQPPAAEYLDRDDAELILNALADGLEAVLDIQIHDASPERLAQAVQRLRDFAASVKVA